MTYYSEAPSFNDKDTLFVIGNGFDLFHGLSTKYNHFYLWLKNNGYTEFTENMSKVFYELNDDTNMWADFERSLSKVDIDLLHEIYIDLYPNAEKDVVVNTIEPTIRLIPEMLRKWIGSISLDNVKPQIPISKEAHFLNFNYTMTLETVYDVPHNRVCHIHNSLDSNQNLIVGCDKAPVDFNILDKKETDMTQTKVRHEAIITLERVIKDTKGAYDAHKSFFENLRHIKKVIVLGHSLSEIDRFYFKKLLTIVPNETKWFVSCYSISERNTLFNNSVKLGIPDAHIFEFYN